MDVVEEICNVILSENKKLEKLSFLLCHICLETLEKLYDSFNIKFIQLEICTLARGDFQLGNSFWLRDSLRTNSSVLETDQSDIKILKYLITTSLENDDENFDYIIEYFKIDIFFFLENFKNSNIEIIQCSSFYRQILPIEKNHETVSKLLLLCDAHIIVNELDDERLDDAFSQFRKDFSALWDIIKLDLIFKKIPCFVSIKGSFCDENDTENDIFPSWRDPEGKGIGEHLLKLNDSKLSFQYMSLKLKQLFKLFKIIDKKILEWNVNEIDMSNIFVYDEIFNESLLKIIKTISKFNCLFIFPKIFLTSEQFLILKMSYLDNISSLSTRRVVRNINISDASYSTEFEVNQVLSDNIVKKFTKCFLYRYDNDLRINSQKLLINNNQLEWIFEFLLENLDKNMKNLSWLNLVENKKRTSLSFENLHLLSLLLNEYNYLQLPTTMFHFSDLKFILSRNFT